MLISLERQSGLPIAFDPTTNTIQWPEGLTVEKIAPRAWAEMLDFASHPAATPTSQPVYTVYRNIARSGDASTIQSSKLRYDITVIPPGSFVGSRNEFFRTAGHCHPLKPDTRFGYPEVYEVIAGRAYWLFQRPNPNDPALIEEIYVVEAGPGEKAVMLPGFGHISINAFAEPLVMANWISDTFSYDYESYRKFRGGGYWLIQGPTPDTVEFEKNPNYRSVPELKKLRPREVPELGLVRSQPLYQFSRELGKLRFLSYPEEFAHILTIDRCYRPVV